MDIRTFWLVFRHKLMDANMPWLKLVILAFVVIPMQVLLRMFALPFLVLLADLVLAGLVLMLLALLAWYGKEYIKANREIEAWEKHSEESYLQNN